MKVLAQFYDPLPPCAKIFSVIKKFAPAPLASIVRMIMTFHFQTY